MRLWRFDGNRLGIVEGDPSTSLGGVSVRDVTPALDVLPQVRYPLPAHDPLIANLPQVLARAKTIASSAPVLSLAGRPPLTPAAHPRQLVAAPVHYQTHLDDTRSDKKPPHT